MEEEGSPPDDSGTSFVTLEVFESVAVEYDCEIVFRREKVSLPTFEAHSLISYEVTPQCPSMRKPTYQ